MTGLGAMIGAADLAAWEAGAVAVVLAPGAWLPPAPGLLLLEWRDGVLAAPGEAPAELLPLPQGLRPAALLAPDAAAAARLAPLLPAGLPVALSAAALAGVLAGALAAAGAARTAAEAGRDLLRRAAALDPPAPRCVLARDPAGGALPAPVVQPLGRAAEGLCGVALHLADPGGGLVATLRAGGRLLGFWRLPPAALRPGWVELDLPEPAPPGPAAAELEVTPWAAERPPLLSTAGQALALRAWTAGPGWSALPRGFDWSAAGAPAPTPGLPLALPEGVLAGAAVEGGRCELVAAGEAAPRLVVEASAGTARLRLPAVAPGPADLLRARLVLQAGAAAVAVRAEAEGGRRETGWRELEATTPTPLALPLPPGALLSIEILLRHGGGAPAMVEIAALGLATGAAGEARRLPLPGPAPAQPAPHRLTTAPPTAAAPLPLAASAPAVFQEFRLHQHLVNAEGTYRHIELSLTGLFAAGRLWWAVRLKLFERRGVVGLELREAKGWPQMFDVWPAETADAFGPFWRLESQGTAAELARLRTPHDHALVAAMLEVLPGLATRAAGAAGLPDAEAEAWARRALRLAEAVAAARAPHRMG